MVEHWQAAVHLREREVDRLLKLHEHRAVPESTVTKAKLKLADARTQLSDAQAAKRQREIEGNILVRDLSPELGALLKERREVLRQHVELVEAKFREGETSFREVAAAVNDLLYAELAMAFTHAARKC